MRRYRLHCAIQVLKDGCGKFQALLGTVDGADGKRGGVGRKPQRIRERPRPYRVVAMHGAMKDSFTQLLS
jgi:hypothetical protein